MLRLIKIIFSLFYLLYIYLARFTYKLVDVTGHQRVVSLYYHSIKSENKARFEKQIDYILKRGEVIPSSDQPPLDSDKLVVIITFDDGFENFKSNALPVLVERKVPVTVFVTTGYIGKKQGWIKEKTHPDYMECVMSEKDLASLPQNYVNLQSHTVSHCRLGELDRDAIWKEITASKKALETIVDYEVTQLAFPYGSYSEDVVDLARIAGYKKIFRNLPKDFNNSEDPFLLGRVPISANDWVLEYKLKVNGGYQWLTKGVDLKSRLKKLLTMSDSSA